MFEDPENQTNKVKEQEETKLKRKGIRQAELSCLWIEGQTVCSHANLTMYNTGDEVGNTIAIRELQIKTTLNFI